MSIDLRTKEGKAAKALIIEAACALREEGWTVAEIAEEVACSPSTISMCLPPQLLHLSDYELDDRREALERGVDHRVVTEERLNNSYGARLAREREERRVERERKRAHRELVRPVREGQRAVRRLRKAFGTTSSPWFGGFDRGPLPLDIDLGARGNDDDPLWEDKHAVDPLLEMEKRLLYETVGELILVDLENLDAHTLERLQRRLLEAGFHPPAVQQKERDRLRVPAPHRGEASAKTWEHMSPDRRSRKQRIASRKPGERTSRKQPKGWKRAA